MNHPAEKHLQQQVRRSPEAEDATHVMTRPMMPVQEAGISGVQRKPLAGLGIDGVLRRTVRGIPAETVQREAEDEGPETTAESSVQRMTAPGTPPEEESAVMRLIRRKCAACAGEEEPVKRKAKGVQFKLEVGAVNDPQEQEADAVAEQVVRRMQAPQISRQEEEESPVMRLIRRKIQRVAYAEGGELDSSTASEIESRKGGGNPLSADVADSMGDAMGADLSSVRIHTDTGAARLASSMDAQAFTYGSDIYFNSGMYDPASSSGQKLLAHELTHTVQQGASPQVDRKARRRHKRDAAGKKVRRVTYFTVPSGKKPGYWQGEDFHTHIMQLMAPANPDLFTEVRIPNASKGMSAAMDETGRADFYKANTTPGLYYEDFSTPKNLSSHRSLRKGGAKFDHVNNAAPFIEAGNIVTTRLNGTTAPNAIELGDLKPFVESENRSGVQQLANYKSGLEYVRDTMRDPKQPKPVNWNLPSANITLLDSPGKINVPDELKPGNTIGAVYDLHVAVTGILKQYVKSIIPGEKTLPTNPPIKGRLVMGHHPSYPGIWNYFWEPVGATTAAQVDPRLDALGKRYRQELVDPLINPPQVQFKKKAAGTEQHTAPAAPPTQAVSRRIQRKRVKDPFDLVKWKAKHKELRKEYHGFEKKHPEALEQAKAAELTEEAAREVSSAFSVANPLGANAGPARDQSKRLHEMDFWSNPATVAFGTFRKLFGRAFMKLMRLYERVKEKVKSMSRRARDASKMGGIKGAALRLIFKLLRLMASFVATQTLDLMLDSLKTGIGNKLEAYFTGLLPEEIEQELAGLKGLETRLTELAEGETEALLGTHFGPALEIIQDIEKIRSTVEPIVSTVSTIIEAAVVIIQCGTPPGIGCLKLILKKLTDKLIAKVLETCWVQNQVAPLLEGIDFFKSIPRGLASVGVDTLRGLLPEELQDIFAPIDTTKVSEKGFQVECGGASWPEGFDIEAYEDMMEAIGEERETLLAELLEKAGVGPKEMLTPERMRAIAEALKKMNEDDFADFVDAYPVHPQGQIITLEEFLKQLDSKVEEHKKKQEEEEKKAEGEDTETPENPSGQTQNPPPAQDVPKPDEGASTPSDKKPAQTDGDKKAADKGGSTTANGGSNNPSGASNGSVVVTDAADAQHTGSVPSNPHKTATYSVGNIQWDKPRNGKVTVTIFVWDTSSGTPINTQNIVGVVCTHHGSGSGASLRYYFTLDHALDFSTVNGVLRKDARILSDVPYGVKYKP